MKTDQSAWRTLWDERGRAVRAVLGETTPPDEVIPFSWDDYVLPGACGMCFGPVGGSKCYTYITLGMTQPVVEGEEASPWEFCLGVEEYASWPHQLLYDLVTFWLTDKGPVTRGLYLPLTFFRNRRGDLSLGLTDDRADLDVVGDVTGLFLWDDRRQMEFCVSSGNFRLMTAVPVTHDEDCLAMETTPPHLLLLLERMGIGQVCNPLRKSVMKVSGAISQWQAIRNMPHDEVVMELQAPVRR